MLLAMLAVVGCGGTGGGDPSATFNSRLVGKWIVNAGTSASALNFNADGSYTFGTVEVTGTASANAQIENGVFNATASSITMTPTEWTCRGSNPSHLETYAFSGGNLVVSDSSGVASFAPNTATATTGVAVTYGCFASDGSFVAQPLAPVN